ncbi:MAG: GIY-YIG nuclease family protein [Candidatus Beckwithbacteria bacterium]|nr:GIY-YIG nuclease family protein [Candidatus Beckwithbacteria bacterium]
MHYTYVLKSPENKLYIGRSSNLKQRLKQHFNKKVKSTKWWKQIKLIFYEAFLAKSDSIRREKYFKTSKGKSSLRQIIRKSLIQ